MVPISIATSHSVQVSLEAKSEARGQKLACHEVEIGMPDVSIENKCIFKAATWRDLVRNITKCTQIIKGM